MTKRPLEHAEVGDGPEKKTHVGSSNATPSQVEFKVATLAERPDLKDAVVALFEGLNSARPGVNSDFGWPIFLYQGPGGQNFFDVINGYPEYQTLIIATSPAPASDAEGAPNGDRTAREELAAVGYATPCYWDGETVEDLPPGWDNVILTAKRLLTDPDSGARPNSMSALAVEVKHEFQGRGLSKMVLGNMKKIAESVGATGLLAPIRPTIKPQYPLVDMGDYVNWRLPDPKNPGQEMVFDPWLRTHIRLGARILKVARTSCTISAPIARWEAWTGLRFLSSGPYTIPGGLNVLHVDTEAGTATYHEDNVWVAHAIEVKRTGGAEEKQQE